MGVFLEEVVLDGPDGVEAEFVGGADLFEAAVVDGVLDVVFPGAGDGDFVEDAEAHGGRPICGGELVAMLADWRCAAVQRRSVSQSQSPAPIAKSAAPGRGAPRCSA